MFPVFSNFLRIAPFPSNALGHSDGSKANGGCTPSALLGPLIDMFHSDPTQKSLQELRLKLIRRKYYYVKRDVEKHNFAPIVIGPSRTMYGKLYRWFFKPDPLGVR